jgi:hypothetical protein
MTGSTIMGRARGAGVAVLLAVLGATLCVPTAAANAERVRKGANYTVSFPSKLERGTVEMRKGAHRVSFALEGAKGRVALRARKALVENALPNVSLAYSIAPEALKEGLVLKNKQAARVFRFRLETGRLRPALQPDRSIRLNDARGKTRMVIPAPFMFDTDPTGVAVSRDVAVTLTRAGGGAWRLTLRPDRRWLSAADRDFPVVVDPTIATTSVADPASGASATVKQMLYDMGFCGRDSGDPYCTMYAPVERILSRGPISQPNCDINGNPKPCKPIASQTFTFVGADPGKPNDPDTTCMVTLDAANPAGRLQYRATNVCETTSMTKSRVKSVTLDTRLLNPNGSQKDVAAQVGCLHTERCGLDPLTTGFTGSTLFADGIGAHTQETIVRITLNEPTDVDPWLETDPRADTPPFTRLEEQCTPAQYLGSDGRLHNRVTIRCRVRQTVDVTSGPGDGNGLPIVAPGGVPPLVPSPPSAPPAPVVVEECTLNPAKYGCPLNPPR